MSRLVWWLAALCCTACAVLVCWAWIDRPLAFWIDAHRLGEVARSGFRPLTVLPDPLIPMGALAFLVLGLRALAGGRLGRSSSVIVVCLFALMTTETIKNVLKWVFGRPWPVSWRGEDPSLIRTGDYAFHWLAGGAAYSSFPSGHMAAAAAVLSVLWIYYPRLRAVCITLIILVGAGLVGSNFHFAGDVLAGAFTGISVAWMSTSLFSQLRLRGPSTIGQPQDAAERQEAAKCRTGTK
jgi:membrane-associated phospholipid phosphatase